MVCRPYRWGNPFVLVEHGGTYTREQSVALFRHHLLQGTLDTTPRGGKQRPLLGVEDVRRLAGRDVVCTCELDQLCHGDVILKLGNSVGPIAEWRAFRIP